MFSLGCAYFLKGQFQSIKSQSFHIDISMYRQMSFPSFLGERMDIPAEYISVAKYRATLGHKLNHSFRANCEEWFLDHPRFGIIPCERTNVGSIYDFFSPQNNGTYSKLSNDLNLPSIKLESESHFWDLL